MKTIFVFLSLLIIFNGCKDSGPGNDSDNLNKYPTRLNNLWEYNTVIITEYYDSLGNIVRKDTKDLGNTILQVKKVNVSLPGYSNLSLYVIYDVNTPQNIQKCWYQNSDKEFLSVAYSNVRTVSLVQPKITANKKYMSLKELFEIVKSEHVSIPVNTTYSEDDSVLYFDPPRRVLAYPLSDGGRWIELTRPWYRERIVEGVVPMQVNGITYSCYKIIVNWPGYDNIKFNDYINTSAGLVKREIISDSILVVDQNNPSGEGGHFSKNSMVSNLVRKNF